MKTENEYPWWQTGVVYEIYVRSFMDSNGDGIGDLGGIIQKLDYLQWLGVKALWLTPVYDSPLADFGYDISDYTSIHPDYGTMDDFDRLRQEVHRRNMKLIMDLVPNHTSNQHPWFTESASSRNNPKKDWYIWQNAKENGGVPNNWLGEFGGSTWEWNENRQQYYLHSFAREQPDLNFRNEEVQKAIFDVMRFWLDKGVDGFRVDSMAHLIKDELFRDNPANPNYQTNMPHAKQLVQVFSTNQPQVHDVVHKMREVSDEYQNTVMIGEIYLSVSGIITYYGPHNKGAQLPANFQLITSPWKADELAVVIAKSEATVPPLAWAHWALGNHDKKRLISRIGKEQAKVAAMLLLSIRGTPTMYYGDEIGMHDVSIPPEEIKDPQGLSQPEMNFSRDPSRTPMQWSRDVHVGFTTGTPWLRTGNNGKEVNVEAERNDEHSLLTLYQRLLHLRTAEPSLCTGQHIPVFADTNLLVYMRAQAGADAFLILLNLSINNSIFKQEGDVLEGVVELATKRKREGEKTRSLIHLAGGEGLIVRLKSKI